MNIKTEHPAFFSLFPSKIKVQAADLRSGEASTAQSALLGASEDILDPVHIYSAVFVEKETTMGNYECDRENSECLDTRARVPGPDGIQQWRMLAV